jgi:DNA repair protein RadD
MELRDYQREAIDVLRTSVRQGCLRICLGSPTGSGKTAIAGAIAAGAIAKSNRMAFVVPAISLIDQTVAAFAKQGIKEVGVIQQDHGMTNPERPVQICSIQTLQARKMFADAAVVVFDECVPGHTLVDTPQGERRIDELAVGDEVFNAIGVGRVLAVRQRSAKLMRLRLSNGRELQITENHPLFTGYGWQKAGAAQCPIGGPMARRPNAFSKQEVHHLWRCVLAAQQGERARMGSSHVLFPFLCSRERTGRSTMAGRRFCDGGESLRRLRTAIWSMAIGEIVTEQEVLGQAADLLAILCQEIQEPDGPRGGAEQGICDAQDKWLWAESKRWQWNASAGTTSNASGGARPWLGGRACSEDIHETWQWISWLLQGRYRQSSVEDRYRGRWGKSQRAGAEGLGSQEGWFFGDVGMEDISDHEQSSDSVVFNIEVSGHPSYFAEGILVHNCHVLHKQHLAWLADEKFKKVPFIGLSATPWTRGLGRYFQSLHVVATTQQMIDAGHLSKFRTFAVAAPDLEGVRIVAGDYHEGELSARCQQDGKLTADIVKTWQERWGKGGTLVFAVDCAHAKQLQERFKAVGATVAYQDAATPIRERNIIREQFQSGEVQVIVNIMTMTIGVDLDVRCISFCRPTRSEMMFVQCIGRGLRTAEGKDALLLLDHSGTTERLGFVTDIDVRHDHLDDGKPKREKSAREAPLPKACEQCGYMSPRRERVCSNCGHAHPEKVSPIVERDGQLVEVTGQRAQRRRSSPHYEATASERLAWYCQLCWIGRDRGYKPGWAAVQYRERFGSWPPREWGMAEPEEPQPKVLSWVKSRMIAWARGRRLQERA